MSMQAIFTLKLQTLADGTDERARWSLARARLEMERGRHENAQRILLELPDVQDDPEQRGLWKPPI